MKKTLFASIALTAGLFIAMCPVVNAQSTLKKVVQTQKVEKTYYTCPMHPQIKKDKAGKCPICGMALVEKKIEVKKTVKMQNVQDTAMMKRQHMMKKGGDMRMKRDTMMKKNHMMKNEGVQKMKRDTAKMKRRIGM